MKTKEEIIKEAWGEYYERVEYNLDVNGYCINTRFLDLKLNKSHFDLVYDTTHESFFGDYPIIKFRPKSLQGIENNNGWIKINSEDDLPKEGHYWIVTKGGDITDSPKNNDIFNDDNYWLSEITHYQPIEKPKPPIY